MRNKKQMNKQALQTKLKRLLIAGGLAALVAVPLLLGNPGMRKVDAAQGDVKINSTNFPDAEFRKYISKNIDLNKDGVLSKAEIKKVTEIRLYISSKNVYGKTKYYKCKNLTGIGVFTELAVLNCSKNKLTKLDVSKNTKLIYLDCSNNKLTKLNIKNNKRLVYLSCTGNKFTKLNARNNGALCRVDGDKNLKITYKKFKKAKVGDYVGACGDDVMRVFRITSTKAGNRTATLVYQRGPLGKAFNSLDVVEITSCTYGNKEYMITTIEPYAFQNMGFYMGQSMVLGHYNKKLKGIGSHAFANASIKNITLEKSIIEIGSSAFTGIKNLKTLTIKSTELTSKTLSKKAFAGITSKTTVKVPKSKLSEYKKLFRKCGLSKNVKVKAI